MDDTELNALKKWEVPLTFDPIFGIAEERLRMSEDEYASLKKFAMDTLNNVGKPVTVPKFVVERLNQLLEPELRYQLVQLKARESRGVHVLLRQPGRFVIDD